MTGKELRKKRLLMGLKQVQLAKKIKRTRVWLCMMETGKAVITDEVMEAVNTLFADHVKNFNRCENSC